MKTLAVMPIATVFRFMALASFCTVQVQAQEQPRPQQEEQPQPRPQPQERPIQTTKPLQAGPDQTPVAEPPGSPEQGKDLRSVSPAFERDLR